MASSQDGGPATITPRHRLNENQKPPQYEKRMRSSSKILEHIPLVETITLNVQESLTSLEPRTSGDGPDVTDDFKDLNQLLADLEAEDNDEKLEVEEDVGLGSPRYIPDELLQTKIFEGLSNTEVKARRNLYGLNQLKEHECSYIKHFASFFVGPIQFVMIGALVLASILRDWTDLGVIGGLLILNAVVGFLEDFIAGNIVKELRKGLALRSIVMRDGVMSEVPSCELVPGDIVHLEEGTIVPADGIIRKDNAELQVDQSAISGESLAVRKFHDSLVYQSSTVKRGESSMVVTAIGDSTYVGRSAALVNAASTGKGHLTRVMDRIAHYLLAFVILTVFGVLISSFHRSAPLKKILNYTLAITIIGVPVGLPAVVTTTMAVGAAYLAKRKAIVQKLSAIESLAGVEILCTDKTGTLTKNKLSLGEPYMVRGIQSAELMLVACLAASRKKRGLDAIDKAFWKALKHYPDTKDVLPSFKVHSFAPFDPVSKKVVAVVESPRGECIECVKGAPPSVFKMVKEANEIPEAVAKKYHETVAEFARRGFRSLGVARKRAKGPWELLGIMPCSDPPRHDTAKTVKEALALGLNIKMLTGDAVGIAKETSRQLGLGENIYNSERLGLTGGGDMPGSKIYDYVEAADGFAEVFPQHKYNVVDVLQKRGHLVAMTGDGVNDAPSLKRADTGIAVEGSSDAARSAADIVFLAPGLSAIIDALKISRQIFHRMYAYVVYRIALSIHLELFLGLWIAYYGDMLQVQLVIFIAIFADIATLAIAYDNVPQSPKPVKWNLPLLWGTAIPMGFILFAGTWVCLRTLPEPAWHWVDAGKIPAWQGQNPKNPDSINGTVGIVEGKGLAHSIIFLEVVLTENWLIFITRAGNRPFWSPMPSWQLLVAIFLVDVLATVFCVLGWFNGGRTTAMTSPLTIVRVWMFSIGVFCVMAGVYHVLATSRVYNCLLHLKWPFKRSRRRRQFEDFIYALQRTSNQHDSKMV